MFARTTTTTTTETPPLAGRWCPCVSPT